MPAPYWRHVRHFNYMSLPDDEETSVDYVVALKRMSSSVTSAENGATATSMFIDLLRTASVANATPQATHLINATLGNETLFAWQPDDVPVAEALSDSILLLTFGCSDWREGQHALFQLANFSLALTFLTPFTFHLRNVVTRSTATLACLLFILLSAFITCQPDTLAWYVALLFVNVVYLLYYLCCGRPVTFQSELEDVYSKLFEPLGVSRDQYRQLVSVAHGVDMTADTTYAMACVTRTGDKLSVVISGQLQVTHDVIVLHTISANQFVDSLEYDRVMSGHGSSDTFQVNIRTTEDCRLITWPVRDLVTYLHRKPFMQRVFTCLVGKDIVHKLNSVQDTVAQHPAFLPLTRHRFERASLVRWKQHMNHGPWRLKPTIELTSANGQVTRARRNKATDSLSFDDLDPGPSWTEQRTATPVGPYSPSQLSLETTL